MDIDKKYRTVSGFPVTLLSVEVKNQGDFTVSGIVKNWLGGSDYTTHWTKEGHWRNYDNHVPCSLNLIEVKE